MKHKTQGGTYLPPSTAHAIPIPNLYATSLFYAEVFLAKSFQVPHLPTPTSSPTSYEPFFGLYTPSWIRALPS
jgi:hypothetical protein